jgi:hypothetical protein
MESEELENLDLAIRNQIKIALLNDEIDGKIVNEITNRELKKFTKNVEMKYVVVALILALAATVLLILTPLFEGLLYISLALLCVLVISYIIYDNYKKNILKRKIQFKQSEKRDIKTELRTFEKKNPSDFYLIKKSIEIANQDGIGRTFLPIIYSEVLSELLITEENPILKENVKRVVYSISLGNFIIESLDLETIVANEIYFEMLSSVLSSFKLILNRQKIDDDEFQYFHDEFKAIKDSILEMELIIEKIREITLDKSLAKKLSTQTTKLRKLIEKEPLSRTKIKEIKSPSGMKKNQTLSTISAIDEEIIEIRTRAGNYYVSRKYFDHEILQERRMFELLTDKELEIKINVLNSTLKMLEQEKKGLTEKEFEEIKSNYLSELFASEQLLAKRKGMVKNIICPNCKAKNSSIKRKCRKCEQDLPFCIVCLNSLGKGDEISICPHCSNMAHTDHFKSWLEKTATCPYCKKKIKKELDVTILESVTKVKA